MFEPQLVEKVLHHILEDDEVSGALRKRAEHIISRPHNPEDPDGDMQWWDGMTQATHEFLDEVKNLNTPQSQSGVDCGG